MPFCVPAPLSLLSHWLVERIDLLWLLLKVMTAQAMKIRGHNTSRVQEMLKLNDPDQSL